jgi:integrase
MITIKRRTMVKIRKEKLKDGRVVWRARGVSTGKDPATGRRRQRTVTCATRRELEAELARLGHAVALGTYVKPWDGLVPELVDSYLRNGSDVWEANTRLSYANALAPAAEWFRYRKARSIVREDIEEYKRHLQASGRRRGGAPGTGLSPRSVNVSLGQLQAAFDLAERDGKVARNPVRFVKRVKRAESKRSTWSEDQVRRFITAAAADPLAACWLLSLLGLRRGEVCGLKWSDVSLGEGTITIDRNRVLVNGKVIEKSTKSARGNRTLPLFQPVTAALEALYARQAAEKDAAGSAYPTEVDDGYVCADELGRPLNPERYSDEFGRLCREAGLPTCQLHDCRHSTNSLLEHLGVPDSLRAAWFGHTIAVNRSTYTHASPSDLVVVSAALGEIFKAM